MCRNLNGFKRSLIRCSNLPHALSFYRKDGEPPFLWRPVKGGLAKKLDVKQDVVEVFFAKVFARDKEVDDIVVCPADLFELDGWNLKEHDGWRADTREARVFRARIRVLERRETADLDEAIIHVAGLAFGLERGFDHISCSSEHADLFRCRILRHQVGTIAAEHGFEREVFPGGQLRHVVPRKGDH